MYVEAGSNRIAVRTPIPTQWNGSATLRKGASGQHVKDLQNMLNSAGYKLSVDGQFGNNTYNALVSFQEKSGITADGIAGSGTYSKLKSYHTTTKIIDNSSSGWTGQTLKEGSSGQSVKDLQTLLNRHGFSSGTIDGKYGNDTEAAVKRFQSKVGLKADGIAGSDTYTKLKNYKAPSNSPSSTIWTGQTLREGNSGDAVRSLQTMLEKAGFDVGTVDGKFGDRTEAAVKAFQRKVGITSDGIAGNTTYGKLRAYQPSPTAYNPDIVLANKLKSLEEKVNSTSATWDSAKDSMLNIAKMGYDFIIGDDIKTLLDPSASTIDKVVAGLSFVPGGKLLNGAVKIGKSGSKFLLKLDLQFFTSKLKIDSKIDRDPKLIKAAEQMGKDPKVQKEADELVQKFIEGNTNPGLGSKNLFGNINYLRGKNGARVFYRLNKGEMEILGKSNKANEQTVINTIKDLYGK